MRERIRITVDDRHVRNYCSIQYEAGGENTRPGHYAGFNHFSLAENCLGARGRIVGCRNAVGKIGEVTPFFLRVDIKHAVSQVSVYVDKSRHDRLATNVKALGIGRNINFTTTTDSSNAVVANYDRAIFDNLVALHRNDSSAAKRNHALWLAARYFNVDVVFEPA